LPPLFSKAVVDIAKLRDYCLDDSHPRGRFKARVFLAALGLTRADAELLQNALLAAANAPTAIFTTTRADPYGQRYQLDFPLTTPTGTATIRSAWIVLTGDDVLRLTTCYVL
jgi:hypothetical protein